jgi:hypothetical protein
LENHGPGNDGEHEKEQQDAAGHPASLRENVSDIRGKDRREQKNDVPLSEKK